MSAPTAFTGFVGTVPTTVYTFHTQRANARGVITFLSLVNTGDPTAVNFRIVPAGQDITGDQWCVLPKNMPLDAVSTVVNPWAVYCKDDYNAPSHVLQEGDQIVLNAAHASRVAARLVVQELMK